MESFISKEGAHVIVGAGAEVHSSVIFMKPPSYNKEGALLPPETFIGSEARIMSGAVIYGGCRIGAGAFVGHNTVLREWTDVGEGAKVAHLVVCEGNARIGKYAAINDQTHLTKGILVEEEVFIGNGVRTTNDRRMLYRRPGHGQHLNAPKIRRAARIGSGALIMAGVEIGENAIVGALSCVMKDVPPRTLVMGRPATVVPEEAAAIPQEEFI